MPAEPTMTLSGRKAAQERRELDQLIDLMNAHGCTSYLEIGARYGDTFYEIGGRVPLKRAVALDLPDAAWGRPDSVACLHMAAHLLGQRGMDVAVHLAASTDLNAYRKITGAQPVFDMILIDADHTYTAVRRDWQLWHKHGKAVAFHDIVGHGLSDRKTGATMGVPRLWGELKPLFKHAEIVADGSRMGIGVIWPGITHS